MSTAIHSNKPPPLPIRKPAGETIGSRPFIAPPDSRNSVRKYLRKSITPQTISVDSTLLLLNESLYGLSVLQPVVPRLDGLLRQITEVTDSLEAHKNDIDDRIDIKIFKAHAPPPTPAVTVPAGPNESPTMQHPFAKPEAGDVTLRLWVYEIQKNAWLFNEKTLQYEYSTTNLLNQNNRRKKLIILGEQVYASWVKVMLNLGLLLNQLQSNRQRITERHVDNLVLATGFEDIADHLDPSEAKRVHMQGEKHLLGYGSEQCFTAAFKRFEIAAKLGLAESHAMVGLMCEFGLGHPKDLALAVKHYTVAIKAGNADAMNNLGRMLEVGKGCEVSTKTAFELYKKASGLGHMDGMTNFAFMLEFGIGCTTNPKLAFETYKMAAEKGYAKAENALGSCYYRGIGTEKDYFMACKNFQAAASKGNANAQNNFGICLEAGHGIPKDVTLAKTQYTLATQSRHGNAACNLAYVIFQQGEYPEAIEKFYLAKALGRYLHINKRRSNISFRQNI